MRREIRRREIERKATMVEEAAQKVIEGRDNREEKRLEDYDCNNLEHFYGDRFLKERKEAGGSFDIGKDNENRKIVTYDLSQFQTDEG